MEAFLVSTGVVAIAEIGDKTQLLSLLLASRFRKPVPIILAILAATLANHGIAGALGNWLTTLIPPGAMKWVLGISFILMAGWTLVPDKLEGTQEGKPGLGVFTATFIAFFLAEMGDKTQVATVALAAKYASLTAVVTGTTIGMLLANAPVVLVGDKLAGRLPLKLIRWIAAGVFVVLGVVALGWG